MNDIQIRTTIAQSEANGLYQKLNDIKKSIAKLEEQAEDVKYELIKSIKTHGKVLAYKDNIPYILTVSTSNSNRLDKKGLAEDIGVSASELNTVGIVELTESKNLSSTLVKSHIHSVPEEKLKERKAKRSDIELIFGR